MKQYIFIVCTFLLLSIGSVTAQNTMSSPINIGTYDMAFGYSDTQNTENYTNDFSNRSAQTNDVFYRFDLKISMDVIISHCNSELDETFTALLDGSGKVLAYTWSSPKDVCSKTTYAYLQVEKLQAGTYFVVSEGYQNNGNITTFISGRVNIPSTCINVGSFNNDFNYTNTQNSANFTNSYQGRTTKDIFYKFDLQAIADVTISHCGSALSATNLTLLNSEGGTIKSINYYVGEDGCSNPSNPCMKIEKLPAGTYYVVSEGYSSDGNITTNISGKMYFYPPHTMNIGVIKPNSYFTHTQNTNTIHYDVVGSSADEMYYSIQLEQPMNIELITCSELFPTNVILLDEFGKLLYEKWGNNEPTHLRVNDLPAGTYLVASEGDAEYGLVTTTIIGLLPIPSTCIDLGTKNTSFVFTDTKNTANYTNAYEGQATNDIFYKFTTDEIMNIQVSHCDSGLTDTYVYLLDEQTQLVAFSGTCQDTQTCNNTGQACLWVPSLDPGTYYVISEGKNQNGNITTQITGTLMETLYITEDIGKFYCGGINEWSTNGSRLDFRQTHVTHQMEIDQKTLFNLTMHSEDGDLPLVAKFCALVNMISGESQPVYWDTSTNIKISLDFLLEPGTYEIHSEIPLNMEHRTRYVFESDCYSVPGTDKGPAARIRYDYNVRSWLTGIYSPHFNQRIYYNQINGNSNPTYNGNISAIEWYSLTKDNTHSYTFAYDALSRLTKAVYSNNAITNNGYNSAYSPDYERVGAGVNADFSVNYTYDKHGNMLTLTRQGKTDETQYGIIDQLTFTYNGNQLQTVTNSGVEVNLPESAHFKNYATGDVHYTFNQNGAMTQDLNKGITNIQYNSLHLPRQMDIKSPEAEARQEYLYSSSGSKLRVTQRWNPDYSTTPESGTDIDENLLTEEKVTDYIGNKIYENGELKKIMVHGGYYDYEERKYYFYIQDHLGNNRLVVNKEEGVVQKNDYYPFGMEFATNKGNNQTYKYNDKELDISHGLNLYDYSARYYEPAIGRFTTMDPLAEKYYSISPYAYVGNNPISRIDPFGLDYWSTTDPEEIARFIGTLLTMQFGEDIAASFDFSSWEHTSDVESAENLTYDDEGGIFYSSFAHFDENGEINVVGVSQKVMYADEESAMIGQLFPTYSDNRLINIYPEYDLLKFSTKSAWEALKYLWLQTVKSDEDDLPHPLGAKMLSGRKGERKRTAKPSGTDNQYKHYRPDEKNPGRMYRFDQNGKKVYQKETKEFREFWDAKQTKKNKKR